MGAAVAIGLALAGCGGGREEGSPGFVSGFYGGAAADEPRSALVARDILSAGGSAADGAVALAFTLSVTYPSSAGLGGGGRCLAYDPRQGRVDSLDFWPRGGQATGGVAPRAAIPGLVRGMSALHARHGKLPWQQILAPAENLARFGDQVSRALAIELSEAGPQVQGQAAVRELFGGASGAAVEGSLVRQIDLAGVLGQVRARGAGEFYVGPLARRIADGIAAAGGDVTLEDLRSYAPRWVEPQTISYGFHVMSFAAGQSDITARTLVRLLTVEKKEEDTRDEQRAHLFVEAVARARLQGENANFGGFNPAEASELASLSGGRTPPPMPSPEASQRRRPGTTSFLVVDREGRAVACVLSMNGPFGAVRIAQGTGVFLAQAETVTGEDGAAVLIHNANNRGFIYASAASGGPAAPAALVHVVQRAIPLALPFEQAIREPRLHHVGAPPLVLHEQNLSAGTRDTLDRRKHRLQPVQALGRVNAMYCARGLPNRGARLCEVSTDPRGAGLAVSADR